MIFTLIVLIAFIILSVVGYRKNNRNLLLSGSLLLLVGLGGGEHIADFIIGFIDGFTATA